MKNTKVMAAVLGILGGAGAVGAHLVAGSLTVKGAEKFKIGEVISVKWEVENTHSPGKFDINLSTNGGSSFQLIETKTFPLSPGVYTYEWTVPNNPSGSAQIQVCQYDATVRCTGVYVLKSNNFSIEASSATKDEAAIGRGAILHFDAAIRTVEVFFIADRDALVTLKAFDAQGKKLATLLDGTQKAGSHRFSVFSNSLDAAGQLLFQLRVGDRVHSFRN